MPYPARPSRRLRLLARISHFTVHPVDGGLRGHETLKVGLDEHFEGRGFLLDGVGQEVESGEEGVGGGIAVDLREEEGGVEGRGTE
jgi:hypothetical protein